MDLYTYVSNGFTRFANVWNFDDFWKRGNTHHAYLRFTAAAEQRFPNTPILGDLRALRDTMIAENSQYFRDHAQNPVFWADDFGWWGMALLAASDALQAMGKHDAAVEQLALAQASWQQMITRGYDASDSARPVPHGCKNQALGGEPGAKNTVTNTNLFLLSVRLFAALVRTDARAAQQYLDMARAQKSWFDAWFNGTSGYLRTFETSDKQTFGLIQERPIAPPDYLDKQHPTWEPGWTWSGDQGLLLAALAEFSLLPVSDGRDPERGEAPLVNPASLVSPAFSKVLLGVRRLLCGTDAVLREAPFNSSFGPDYGGDYVAGRGILMRYLSEPSVRRVHGAPFAPEAIIATATAVWNSRDPSTSQFAADWTPGNNQQFNLTFREHWGQGDVDVSWAPGVSFDGVRQAAGLDVLTAAMSLG